MLSTILGIDIEEEDDPYIVIPRNELGTLIHSVFEKFQKDKSSLNEILTKANHAFDNFLKMKPAMIPSSMIKQREDYLRLITNLYEMDPGNIHIKSEKYIKGSIGGITFSGTADRLEKTKSGQYIIVDYKTGTKVTHIDDDPVTCIQGLIYAYLFENYAKDFEMSNIKVDHIEFRYPENKNVISIQYNEETKIALLDLINQFVDTVKSGQLFKEIDKKGQKYIEKYSHLFSLMKGVQSL